MVRRFRSIGVHWNGVRRRRQVATANGMRSTDAEKRRTLDDGSRQTRTRVTTARDQRTARRSPSANQSQACQIGGGICAANCSSVSGSDGPSLPAKIPKMMLKTESATNGRKQRSNAISPGRRRCLRATCLVFIYGRREETPNDPKPSDRGGVRWSAWLGVAVISDSSIRRIHVVSLETLSKPR